MQSSYVFAVDILGQGEHEGVSERNMRGREGIELLESCRVFAVDVLGQGGRRRGAG